MVVLDTDFLVALLRGNQDAQKKAEKLDTEIFTTSINALELFEGANRSSQKEKRLEEVDKLLRTIGVLNFDTEAARLTAQISNKLKKDGKMLDLMDIMIASIVKANKQVLITRNVNHFSRIAGLRIEKW